MTPFGLHGKDFPQFVLDEFELGKRVASWLSSENSAPEIHFEDYGIEREDHWLHFAQ